MNWIYDYEEEIFFNHFIVIDDSVELNEQILPKNKIDWLGQKMELTYLIDELMYKKIIRFRTNFIHEHIMKHFKIDGIDIENSSVLSSALSNAKKAILHNIDTQNYIYIQVFIYYM